MPVDQEERVKRVDALYLSMAISIPPETMHEVKGNAMPNTVGPGPSRPVASPTFKETGIAKRRKRRCTNYTTAGIFSTPKHSSIRSRQLLKHTWYTTCWLQLFEHRRYIRPKSDICACVAYTRMAIPTEVTAEGRRPSYSFLFQELSAPPYTHTHTHSASGETRNTLGPETSDSHTHTHTHGKYGIETTIGTMTEATTKDHHTIQEIPRSDIGHILRPAVRSSEEGEERRRQPLETRIPTPPMPGQWLDMPRLQ